MYYLITPLWVSQAIYLCLSWCLWVRYLGVAWLGGSRCHLSQGYTQILTSLPSPESYFAWKKKTKNNSQVAYMHGCRLLLAAEEEGSVLLHMDLSQGLLFAWYVFSTWTLASSRQSDLRDQDGSHDTLRPHFRYHTPSSYWPPRLTQGQCGRGLYKGTKTRRYESSRGHLRAWLP